jgi:Type IV secretion system pilin
MHSSQARRKTIKQIIFWTIILGAFIALFVPVLTNAQPANVCEVFGNCAANIDQYSGGGTDSLAQLILTIAYTVVYILGAVSVLFMIIGGYSMISSGGDSAKYKKGLDTVKNAIIGIILSIASFAIVSVIGSVFSTINIGG